MDSRFGLNSPDLEVLEDLIAFYRILYEDSRYNVYRRYGGFRGVEREIVLDSLQLRLEVRSGDVIGASITIGDGEVLNEIFNFLRSFHRLERLRLVVKGDFAWDFGDLDIRTLDLEIDRDVVIDLKQMGGVRKVILKGKVYFPRHSTDLKSSSFPTIKRLHGDYLRNTFVVDEKSYIERIFARESNFRVKANCPKLREVSLDRCELSVEAERPFPILRKVNYIALRDDKRMPEELLTNCRLTHLKLKRVGSSYSDHIWNNRSLRLLSLIRIKMGGVPGEMEELSRLKSLKLDLVGLKELEPVVGTLWKLEHLSLKRNPLRSLPDSLSRLRRLKSLSLERTDIEEVPDVVRSMRKLEFLNLVDTKIEQLPKWLDELPLLKIRTNSKLSSQIEVQKNLKDRIVYWTPYRFRF